MKTITLAAALALLAFATPALAQPSPEQIIADNDKNGDKGIDAKEWPAEAPIPFPVEADTNKDGKIDAAEFQAMFAGFQGGPPPPPPPAQPPAQPQG